MREMEKGRLCRSRTNRMIWGVCGGLAEYFDIDPTIIRVVMILLSLANGAGILMYILLAIVVPLEGSKSSTPEETIRENVEEIKVTTGRLGEELGSALKGEGKAETADKGHQRSVQIFGVILILIGVLVLLGNLGLLWWVRGSHLWPLAVVAIGVLIIVRARR
ncbi:MAG: PspC domain-containing protein [Chloroflexota bacterium]